MYINCVVTFIFYSSHNLHTMATENENVLTRPALLALVNKERAWRESSSQSDTCQDGVILLDLQPFPVLALDSDLEGAAVLPATLHRPVFTTAVNVEDQLYDQFPLLSQLFTQHTVNSKGEMCGFMVAGGSVVAALHGYNYSRNDGDADIFAYGFDTPDSASQALCEAVDRFARAHLQAQEDKLAKYAAVKRVCWHCGHLVEALPDRACA